MALAQTSPAGAEQIYLATSPDVPSAHQGGATQADTFLLPGST